MGIMHSGIMVGLFAVQCMHTSQKLSIQTIDKKVTFFEKAYINQSLVLSVLYAHQIHSEKK